MGITHSVKIVIHKVRDFISFNTFPISNQHVILVEKMLPPLMLKDDGFGIIDFAMKMVFLIGILQ
jgi:hypothetical protein